MRQYQYLIIGGGLAGDAAVRGIRELDPIGDHVRHISQDHRPCQIIRVHKVSKLSYCSPTVCNNAIFVRCSVPRGKPQTSTT